MNAGKRHPQRDIRVRTYVLYPYKLVRDHRTGVETTRVRDVLDGKIDEFITASIRVRAGETSRL